VTTTALFLSIDGMGSKYFNTNNFIKINKMCKILIIKAILIAMTY